MRLYYMVSGILLIIGFAVAAPVPVQKKHEARVDVMNIPEDAMTMLRRPEGLPAAHPSSSTPPPRPANAPLSPSDGLNMFWLNLVGPPAESHIDALNKMWLNLVGTPAESHLDALNKYWLNLVGHPTESHHDTLNNMWLNLIGHPESHFPSKPGELPAAHPSSIPPPPGPADGPTDVEQPLLPSTSKELPQVSNPLSPDYALLSPGDALSKMSLSLVDHPESHFLQKPDDSSGAGPSSISQPSSPADGSMDVDQRPPSIPEEPLQVSSPDHAPPSPDNSDEMNELWPDILEHRPLLDLLDHPEDSSSTGPSSISQPSSLTDGSMDVEQQLPSIPEKPLQVSSPDHAPPSPPVDSDEMNELWPDILDHRPWLDLLDHPEDSSGARPPSVLQPSSPTYGSMDVEQRLPSIPEEPLKVSSPGHAPPSPVDSDEMNELWPDILEHRPWLDLLDHPEDSSGARPPSVLQPSSPTDGSMDVEQRLPSVLEEPLKVFSPDHALPGPDDEMNELRPDILDHPEDSSAAHPLWGLPPPGPAHEWTHFVQWLSSVTEEASLHHAPPSPGLLTGFGNDFMNGDELHWPPFPESSTMFSADNRLMGAHAPPNPGPSTEPDDEMTDATINPEAID